MRLEFVVACMVSIVFTLIFSDLSQVYTLVKIPIRIISLSIMILPIYLFVVKYRDIKKAIFKESIDKKKIFKLMQIVSVFIFVMFAIRFFTYTSDIFTFAKSLHYGDYLIVYLTIGYMSHVFLQDFLIVLFYEGLDIVEYKNKNYIFLISFFFGLSHLFMGIFNASLTFLGAVIFLFTYKKFGNILIPNILHYILGIIAISFGWA